MPRWWRNFSIKCAFAHVVLDPVIQPSAGGPDLLDAGGVKYLGEELMKRASVVTPNIAEAALLSGLEIKDVAGMEAAARKLVERGARAVVVKGGHMDKAVDVLFDGTEVLHLRRRSRQDREHARLRLHFCFGHRRATGLRPSAARSRDARQGLRHQGHRERLLHRQRRRSARSFLSHAPRAARCAAFTKCRSTACIPPLNPAQR